MSGTLKTIIGGGLLLSSLIAISRHTSKIEISGRAWQDKEANIPFRNATVVVHPTNKVQQTSEGFKTSRVQAIPLPAGSQITETNNDGKWSLTLPWRNSHYGAKIYAPVPYQKAANGTVKMQTEVFNQLSFNTFDFRNESNPIKALTPYSTYGNYVETAHVGY